MGRLNSHRADPRVWRREITNSLGAGPEKMDEHKQDENEGIEKKVDIFHILNGILAKTWNLISWKRFPGRSKDS